MYRCYIKFKVISCKMLIWLPGLDISLTWFNLSEVKVIPRSNCKCLTFYRQAGGGPSTERHSCCIVISSLKCEFL